MSKFFTCPVCGEDVKVGALSCPGCGACEKTGLYGDGSEYDGVDLSEDDFDYDAYLEKEFGTTPPPSRKELILGGIAIVLIVLLTYVFLFFR